MPPETEEVIKAGAREGEEGKNRGGEEEGRRAGKEGRKEGEKQVSRNHS